YHLDNLHQRHGVEEMEARDSLRTAAAGGDAGDRQGRGIGRQQAVLADNGFQVGEQLLLHFEDLDNGLDDQVAILELFQLRGRLHAGVDRLEFGFAELALGDLALEQVAVEGRSEEHTSELQSRENLVCRLLLEKKNK